MEAVMKVGLYHKAPMICKKTYKKCFLFESFTSVFCQILHVKNMISKYREQK